jgi:hypothetical protein
MNTNKFLIGGIIGGIANFLLGWLVWGMLLMNFMKEHTSEIGKTVMRGDDDIIWWALIVGNLLFGLLLSYILNKAGVMTAATGASTGAVIGLLFAATINIFNYAFMNLGDMTGMGVDIIASTIVTGIVGGVIGWYVGMGKKAVA